MHSAIHREMGAKKLLSQSELKLSHCVAVHYLSFRKRGLEVSGETQGTNKKQRVMESSGT